MANVILIRPISQSWEGEKYYRSLSIPHGPLTLAGHLIDKGFTANIIDEIAMTEYIENEDIVIAAVEKLKKELNNEVPVCVGITTMTGEQIRRGKIFANIVRQFNKNIPIVWGGAHPTLLPEMTMQDDMVDIIATGEGDISFPILVRELKKNGTGDLSKVPGIVYFDKDKKIKRTKQPPLYRMDDMPAYPYHLLDMEVYVKGIKKKKISRYFEINSSRGCPYKCSFCLNSKDGIPYTKSRSDRIIQEMKILKDNYQIDGILFNDENFILNKKRIREIAQACIDLNLNFNMRGSGRVELFLKFDDKDLALFKKAGFYHWGLGVESGSNKTLESIQKQITEDQIYQVVDALTKHKFEATYNFIGGFPYETVEEYKKTLRVIHYIFEKCTYMVYPVAPPRFYTPLPGTKSCDDAVKLGYKLPQTMEEWSKIDYNRADEMPWVDKELHDLVIESREIINNINRKFIGDNAVITKNDLAPLKAILN
tara:strand:- start:38 stop:1480 length:1443 start_codon:yes stop_codon:yes gene_type:complete